MPELPWVKWYPSYWASEPGIRLCDAATRGIWMEAINQMFLRKSGFVQGTVEQLCVLFACRKTQMETAIFELKEHGVAEVVEQNGSIKITCRRNARDCKISYIRREAALSGSAKRQQTSSKSYEQTGQQTSTSISTSTSKGECEGDGTSVEVNGHPSLDEVLGRAGIIGLAPWRAQAWWEEMEGCGWLDYRGRPVRKWQPILNTVKTKWESDGRPTGPGKKPEMKNTNPQNYIK